jgi:hypothetical protein
MNFVRILILTFMATGIAILTQRAIGVAEWWAYVVPIPYAAICYVANVLLLERYIERNAPELANFDEAVPGVQTWALTARTGVVPKWVSLIGLLAIGFIPAIPFQLIATLLR